MQRSQVQQKGHTHPLRHIQGSSITTSLGGLTLFGVIALDVLRFQPFVTLNDLEIHHLTFIQSLETIPTDGRVMDKNIRPGFFLDDEPKSLLIIKPFNFSAGHNTCLLNRLLIKILAWLSDKLDYPGMLKDYPKTT